MGVLLAPQDHAAARCQHRVVDAALQDRAALHREIVHGIAEKDDRARHRRAHGRGDGLCRDLSVVELDLLVRIVGVEGVLMDNDLGAYVRMLYAAAFKDAPVGDLRGGVILQRRDEDVAAAVLADGCAHSKQQLMKVISSCGNRQIAVDYLLFENIVDGVGDSAANDVGRHLLEGAATVNAAVVPLLAQQTHRRDGRDLPQFLAHTEHGGHKELAQQLALPVAKHRHAVGVGRRIVDQQPHPGSHTQQLFIRGEQPVRPRRAEHRGGQRGEVDGGA